MTEAFSYQSNLLRRAIIEANRVVLEKSLENQELSGMGSTVAGMAIRDFTASAINVGDSRIYLIRDNSIEQISVDHTLAEDQVGAGAMTPEEADDSELKHVLSSVLGVDSEIQVHMDELSILAGDIFLMLYRWPYSCNERRRNLGHCYERRDRTRNYPTTH